VTLCGPLLAVNICIVDRSDEHLRVHGQASGGARNGINGVDSKLSGIRWPELSGDITSCIGSLASSPLSA
jgi:hypothetical protein